MVEEATSSQGLRKAEPRSLTEVHVVPRHMLLMLVTCVAPRTGWAKNDMSSASWCSRGLALRGLTIRDQRCSGPKPLRKGVAVRTARGSWSRRSSWSVKRGRERLGGGGFP